MQIISIQSAVAYGHVGNSAAVFPLQRLGAEVWPINTVQFSNHPGYGAFAGTVSPPDTIAALFAGIAARGVLPQCDALLSGYIGDPGTGTVILDAAEKLRAANPAALWCCDPVIGDQGPGVYVRAGVPEFFRDQAVPAADVLTPNFFELQYLSGLPCTTLEETRAAASALQARMRAAGPRIVLITSVRLDDTPDGALDVLAASGTALHRVRTPLLPFTGNGAGDTIAALFLFHLLRAGDVPLALAAAASAVHGLIRHTLDAGSRELLLIAAQDEIASPAQRFEARECWKEGLLF
jgi:pyridoxine kinase